VVVVHSEAARFVRYRVDDGLGLVADSTLPLLLEQHVVIGPLINPILLEVEAHRPSGLAVLTLRIPTELLGLVLVEVLGGALTLAAFRALHDAVHVTMSTCHDLLLGPREGRAKRPLGIS
jgi:hypothetical protein